jgi:glycosyltransferase involved in cell wall biosynthesis
LPNTVLEALACAIPVVGFDVGGIRDMVRPGVNGLLAPPGDVAALREALITILRDPSKRCEMAEAAFRVASSEYALSVQARRYRNVYLSMLAGARPRVSTSAG